MYFDTKPCEVCGSEVRLRPHDSPREQEADATVDERTCTNPDCPTHQRGGGAPPP